MMDYKLTSRVVGYMASNPYVDVSIMASDLQLKYPRDYGRRKKNAFKKLVNEVYEVQKYKTSVKKRLAELKLDEERSLNIHKQNSMNTGNMKEDSEAEFIHYKDTNLMNVSLSSMYNADISGNNTPLKLTPLGKTYNYDEDHLENVVIPSKSKSQASNKRKLPEVQNISFDNDTSVGEIINNSIIEQYDESLQNVPTSAIAQQPNKSNPNTPKTKRRKSRNLQKNDTDNNQNKMDDAIINEINSLRKSKYKFEESKITFKNVGGNEKTLNEVCKLLIHVKHPEVYKTLGVTPPHGMLLHGPPGCGKTLLANAIAGELEIPVLKLAGPEIVSGISGESEQKLRDVFETANENTPCIIFIDEIDAIAPKRENASKEQERRIVAQLLSCMDNLSDGGEQVLIIGATNRPDSLDPGLRRAGRFDREICMGIPSEKAREDILRVLCTDLKLQEDFNFSLTARLTPGYVGADLLSLCREAAASAVSRILTEGRNKISTEMNTECDENKPSTMTGESNSTPQVEERNESCNAADAEQEENKNKSSNSLENDVNKDIKIEELTTDAMLNWIKNPNTLTQEELDDLYITMKDFEAGMKVVQPSAKREGFATVPDVTWDDIGALKEIRQELSMAILAPVRNPDVFKELGLEKPSGVLLAGPPGCGKTMLAKAIANESGINFISVKGPELLNMYVGESERAVRQCFQRAQNSSPCVIFFDELDSLCPRRSGVDTGSSARVVNQMLTEMDGLQSRKQVFVMGATNRPDIIDPAILRPGRLDKILHVDLPTKTDRYEILQAITKYGTRPKLSPKLSLSDVANDKRCDGFTGADLSALVREASVNALRKYISQEHVLKGKTANVFVTWDNFENAFLKVKPSVSAEDKVSYQRNK